MDLGRTKWLPPPPHKDPRSSQAHIVQTLPNLLSVGSPRNMSWDWARKPLFPQKRAIMKIPLGRGGALRVSIKCLLCFGPTCPYLMALFYKPSPQL